MSKKMTSIVFVENKSSLNNVFENSITILYKDGEQYSSSWSWETEDNNLQTFIRLILMQDYEYEDLPSIWYHNQKGVKLWDGILASQNMHYVDYHYLHYESKFGGLGLDIKTGATAGMELLEVEVPEMHLEIQKNVFEDDPDDFYVDIIFNDKLYDKIEGLEDEFMMGTDPLEVARKCYDELKRLKYNVSPFIKFSDQEELVDIRKRNYKILIHEYLDKEVEIDASSEEEALKIVKSRYDSEKIVLDSSDFTNVDFEVII